MTIKCPFSKLECDINFGLPVIAVLSFVYSLWTIKYFMRSVGLSYYDRQDDLLAHPTVHTYLFISFATSVLLYNGFKNIDKKYIQYWYLLKYVEFFILIVGTIILFSTSRFPEWLLCLVAVILFGVGWYLLSTVKAGCRYLNLELGSITTWSVFQFTKSKDGDNSSSLEEVDNQKIQEHLSPLAASILRDWGYLKLFEFVIVAPGILFIIIISNSFRNSYHYLFIFYYSIGVGIIFILCGMFVWKMLPVKPNTNIEKEVLVNNE